MSIAPNYSRGLHYLYYACRSCAPTPEARKGFSDLYAALGQHHAKDTAFHMAQALANGLFEDRWPKPQELQAARNCGSARGAS